MVTIDSAATIDIGRTVGEAVLTIPHVQGLWMRRHGTVMEFWVLTAPTPDLESERALTDVEDLFYDRLPGVELEVRVINPAHFAPFDLATVIPPDAVRVTIHHSEPWNRSRPPSWPPPRITGPLRSSWRTSPPRK